MTRRTSTDVHERIEHIVDDIEFVSGDLLDQTSITAIVAAVKPDEVYNLAAQSFVPTSWDQPVLTGEFTALGVTRVLEAIRTIDPQIRFYQASSFGDVRQGAERAAERGDPVLSALARTASRSSTATGSRSTTASPTTSTRSAGILFNHESSRRGKEFVTRKITDGVARIKLGLAKELRLGNLDARRDWGFAGDYVRAMWLMLQQPAPDDYVDRHRRDAQRRRVRARRVRGRRPRLGTLRRRRSALLPAGRSRHAGRRCEQSARGARLGARNLVRAARRDDGASGSWSDCGPTPRCSACASSSPAPPDSSAGICWPHCAPPATNRSRWAARTIAPPAASLDLLDAAGGAPGRRSGGARCDRAPRRAGLRSAEHRRSARHAGRQRGRHRARARSRARLSRSRRHAVARAGREQCRSLRQPAARTDAAR